MVTMKTIFIEVQFKSDDTEERACLFLKTLVEPKKLIEPTKINLVQLNIYFDISNTRFINYKSMHLYNCPPIIIRVC